MELIVIVSLILVSAVVVLYATKFLSKTYKVVTKIFILGIVTLAIITVLVYNDIQDLRRDISSSTNLFIVREDNATYASVGFKPVNTTTYDLTSFDYPTKQGLEEIDQKLDNEEVPSEEAGRTFVFTPDLLNQSYEMDLGVKLDQNDLLEVIKSSDPYTVLAEKLNPTMKVTKENLERAYGEAEKIKGYFLAALVINYFQKADTSLLDNVKSGDLRAIPETISFKVLKYAPRIGIG